MPRKYRKYKKSRRRKNYKLLKSPTPKKFITKMRYSSYYSLAPITGLTAGVILSANGLYDPDVGGAGHQPRAFDQLMALYDHYVVLGSKIRVDFINTSSTVPCIGFVAVQDDAILNNVLNNYKEGGTVKTVSLSINSGNSSTRTIVMKCNPAKYLGRSSPMSDPELKGSALANPTEQAFFHVGASSADQTSTGAVTVHYTIEYICALIEPKTPPQS